MNDVIIFSMGCFVSLVVAGAVGLLLYGAANEPRGNLVPQKESEKSDPVAHASRPVAPASADAQVLESKSGA